MDGRDISCLVGNPDIFHERRMKSYSFPVGFPCKIHATLEKGFSLSHLCWVLTGKQVRDAKFSNIAYAVPQ